MFFAQKKRATLAASLSALKFPRSALRSLLSVALSSAAFKSTLYDTSFSSYCQYFTCGYLPFWCGYFSVSLRLFLRARAALTPVFTIIPELSDAKILKQLQEIQRANGLKPSDKLEKTERSYNLTIEMETGVGKTYTYIKTIFELNKHYGWTKFIVVVPSVAIREGVYKSFMMTQEHFAEEYGKKITAFIYNSSQLSEIDHFASDSAIRVMIINSQAFNAKGKDARRIYMKLDEFRSRRPIDVIAKTNPVLIIDEPQSVEGKQTKERLKEFCPLLTLRYSATHKSDSIYNMVYRLDAMEAYNKRLVKKIAVKGITETGSTATDSYIYLESINLSASDPTATLQFEVKMANGTTKKKIH